jgi:hypothetical protein
MRARDARKTAGEETQGFGKLKIGQGSKVAVRMAKNRPGKEKGGGEGTDLVSELQKASGRLDGGRLRSFGAFPVPMRRPALLVPGAARPRW